MFLFILESIGTQELLLIAAVALIVFGPRKLPQMAKTIAKTMAEFKNATNEFKSTWEKEANFEEEIKSFDTKVISPTENSIARRREIEENISSTSISSEPLTPEIKELSSEEVARIFQNKEIQKDTSSIKETQTETSVSAKKDWL